MSNQDWIAEADNVDQSTVETKGPEYPFVQWQNGQPGLKKAGGVSYSGGWFVQDGQIDAALLAGWEKGEMTHRDNTSTEGFFMRDLTVAVIRMRRRWIAEGVGYPWDQYDQAAATGKATGHLQVLCVIKDMDVPIVLTMKGTVCRAFQGSQKAPGVLSTFSRSVVAEANLLAAKRGSKSKFPYRAFWITTGPQRNADGSPVFTTVGQNTATSVVTLPTALNIVAKPQPGDLSKLFVGAELLKRFSELYVEAEAWAIAWDKPQEAAETVVNGAAAPEEELPF